MINKTNTEKFIEEAQKLNPNIDFTLTYAPYNRIRIAYECKIHGRGMQSQKKALAGECCESCIEDKKSAELKNRIVDAVSKTHPNVELSRIKNLNNETMVTVYCKKCGNRKTEVWRFKGAAPCETCNTTES